MRHEPTQIDQSRENRRAFTVLEVLVAITIFSIVSLVVFSVFGAAIRSQRIGDREAQMLARGRFALDAMERDLTNMIFREETAYNIAITQAVEEMERQRLLAEQSGRFEDFFGNYGDPSDPRSLRDARIGNPYDKGRIIDMQVIGKDSGRTDSLTFTVHHPLAPGTPYRPFGMAKVKYFVEKGQLIRSADSIEAAPRNQFGESFAKPEPPDFTRLADNVKEFDLSYAFWFDNQWYEVREWQSTNRLIRNAKNMQGDYRDGSRDRMRQSETIGQIRPGDPGWNQFVNDQLSEPLDRLPALIRARLTLADADNSARTVTLQRIFRVFASEETYEPWQELNEEEREVERDMRDRSFRMIFPGVTN